MLNGKEDETVRICSEERFGGEEFCGFGGSVLRWWIERGGGSCGCPRGAGCISTEFLPIVAVVADEVGDFAEGLIRYGVL